eukprot:TRINITY_DN1117_c0_g1_i7.p2 TRINITY_DN1117_c0_g1~~TRINITY_DN1117_c0_g1_i7.p2  ORF type:complete len:105 (+),score=13.04 TRINITY_DN1117_c0_g1_i7:599-913(+)
MDDDLDIDHAELIARYLKLSEKFNELLRADKQLTMAYHAMSQLKVEQDIQLEITNQQLKQAQEQVIRLSRSIASGTVRPTSQSFHHFSIRSSPYLSPLSSALHY